MIELVIAFLVGAAAMYFFKERFIALVDHDVALLKARLSKKVEAVAAKVDAAIK